MIVEASVTGLFRMLLIIVGVMLLLRFLGQFMIAKRNMEEEREMNASRRAFDEEKQRAEKNKGKIRIIGEKRRVSEDIEDVDFEDVE